MLPIWAIVLLVLFVPAIVKMMFDSASGQRGGTKIMGIKLELILGGIVALWLLGLLMRYMGIMY